MVYTSISLPVLLDKGAMGNEVSGFQEKNNFPLMWFFLHFTPSLHFTFSLQSAFYTQSAFYLWSAVCSPQSTVFILHWPDGKPWRRFEQIEIVGTFWKLASLMVF